MLEKDKKEIYNRVMENISKQVKGMLMNEAALQLEDPLKKEPVAQRYEKLKMTMRRAANEMPKALPVILNVLDAFEQIIENNDEKRLQLFLKVINPK